MAVKTREREVVMFDITIGPVINVIDGNTFTMQVTRIGTNNNFPYNNYETIRINNYPAHSLSTLQGQIDKKNLIDKIIGKNVRCHIIHYRDAFGVLIANVELL